LPAPRGRKYNRRMRTLSLGFSPCPNDTFIFYALARGKIPGRALAFRPVLEDVETLNRMALRGALDLTKASFGALGLLREQYVLLRSGAALGRGCGPLVVARGQVAMDALRGKRIAVPGEHTTANLLLRLHDPALAENAASMPFHRVMEAVRDGEAEAGVIIHESRFTYPSYGLVKVLDLGEWWESETGHPIPLGCILARRTLGEEAVRCAEDMIRESVRYAFENPEAAAPYVREHARELDRKVIAEHIGLYVNDYTVDLGQEGRAAVRELLGRAAECGVAPPSRRPLFLDEV
jgi:1,4-dihydroxy-6-naphthoate synthase